MRRRAITSLELFGALALVLIVACSDGTAPAARRIPGAYEFTTVLDSFTHAASCTSTSDGTRCVPETIAAGPSKLYGTFTLGDDASQQPSGEFQFPVSDVVLHQADCALSSTECVEETWTWYGGGFTVRRDSLTLLGHLAGEVHMMLSGRFVDDSFVGTVYWYTYVGCCSSSYYSGTFVARRKR